MSYIPKVGDIVDGAFRVEAEIDSGNFGYVYRVTMLTHDFVPHDRTLALKVLKTGPHDEDELRQRFEREASLIYSLHHPHIVEVYYSGETESGLPYMAMEFLKGTDLRTLLRAHGALNPKLARRITLEVLSALSSAHKYDIIHRDLKPANIFLVNDGKKGHVKVLDFGFAKCLEDSQETVDEITTAGTLVGTPAYMSPELVHKRDVGPPADIYSVGLILAEMLSGDKLVKIESIYETILFQASKEEIALPDTIVGTPFEPIVRKAISKQLEDRYQTAKEMAHALLAIDFNNQAQVEAMQKRRQRKERFTESVPVVTPAQVQEAMAHRREQQLLKQRTRALQTEEDFSVASGARTPMVDPFDQSSVPGLRAAAEPDNPKGLTPILIVGILILLILILLALYILLTEPSPIGS